MTDQPNRAPIATRRLWREEEVLDLLDPKE